MSPLGSLVTIVPSDRLFTSFDVIVMHGRSIVELLWYYHAALGGFLVVVKVYDGEKLRRGIGHR